MYLYFCSMASHRVTTHNVAAARRLRRNHQNRTKLLKLPLLPLLNKVMNCLYSPTKKEQLLYRQKKKGKNVFKCIKTSHWLGKKCNKAIFRGAGKMTLRAYAAAVSKINWEPKFLEKGRKTQVTI